MLKTNKYCIQKYGMYCIFCLSCNIMKLFKITENTDNQQGKNDVIKAQTQCLSWYHKPLLWDHRKSDILSMFV